MHRPGYLRVIDNALKNYILPAFGDRPLSTLRRSDAQGFVSSIAQDRSANSVHNIYRVLSQVMGAAVDDLLVPASPCARVKLPSRPTAEVKPPAPPEVAALADGIARRQRALVVLLAGTGLRISDALGRVVGDELAAHLAAYGPAPDGSIFIDDLGRPLIYTAWKPLWRTTGTSCKTHDLRHYAASAPIAGERR